MEKNSTALTKHDIALIGQVGVLSFLASLAASEQFRDVLMSLVPEDLRPLVPVALGLIATLLHKYVSKTNPDGGPVAAPYVPEERRTVTRARTDRHNNPTAFTTDVAKQAGLIEGIDYVKGDPFKTPSGKILYTARLLKDPIRTTIAVIDKIGFFTSSGAPRWLHTAISRERWMNMSYHEKIAVVRSMYRKEGGTELAALFEARLRAPVA